MKAELGSVVIIDNVDYKQIVTLQANFKAKTLFQLGAVTKTWVLAIICYHMPYQTYLSTKSWSNSKLNTHPRLAWGLATCSNISFSSSDGIFTMWDMSFLIRDLDVVNFHSCQVKRCNNNNNNINWEYHPREHCRHWHKEHP